MRLKLARRRTGTKEPRSGRRPPRSEGKAYTKGIVSGAVRVAAQVQGNRIKPIAVAYRDYAAADIDTNETGWRGTSSGDTVNQYGGRCQRTCGSKCLTRRPGQISL